MVQPSVKACSASMHDTKSSNISCKQEKKIPGSFIGWGVYTVGLFYRDKVFKKYSDSWAKVKTKKKREKKSPLQIASLAVFICRLI